MNPQSESPTPATPKRSKWLRLTIIGLSVVVILILTLVALLPTIASTAPVRSAVVGVVNGNLNGKLSIDSWSLSWFGPIEVNGIKVTDSQQRSVVEVARVKTDLGLLNAIRGKFDLGDTRLDRPNLVMLEINADGTNNLSALIKSDPATTPAAPGGTAAKAPPVALPAITGKVTITGMQATASMAAAAQPQTIKLEPSDMVIDLSNIEKAILAKTSLALRVNDLPPGTIALDAALDVITNDALSLDTMAGTADVQIAGLDLAALAPALAGADIAVAGLTNGQLTITAPTPDAFAATGKIVVSRLAVSGPALAGDTYASSQLAIAVNASRAGAAAAPVWKLDGTGITTDHLMLTVTGTAPQAALEKAAAGLAPAAEGQLAVALTLTDAPGLAAQLKNTLALAEGVQITSGAAQLNAVVKLLTDKTTVATTTSLTNIAGLRDGRPITLQPLTFAASADIAPGANGKPAFEDVFTGITNISAKLESAFATFSAQGANLRTLSGGGNADLNALTSQLSQFADLGTVKARGTAVVSLSMAQASATTPLQASASVSLEGLSISGIEGVAPLSVRRLTTDIRAFLPPSADGSFNVIDNASLTINANDSADRPAISAAITGNYNLTTSAGAISIQKFSIPDLASIQRDYAALLPPAAQASQLDGSLTVSGDLAVTSESIATTKNLAIALDSLTVVQDGKRVLSGESLSAALGLNAKLTPAGVSSISLPTLEVTSSFAKVTSPEPVVIENLTTKPTARGTITLDSDLAKLSAVAAAFTGSEFPYGGQLSSMQKLSTDPSGYITLAGTAGVKRLVVMQAGRVAFAEDDLAIANDITLNPAGAGGTLDATIRNLSVDMRSSKALSAKVAGGVRSIGSGNIIDQTPVTIAATYDAAKLFELARPFLDPALAASLRVAGTHTTNWKVTGSYPMTEPANLAIQKLNIDGTVELASLDYSGLKVESFNMPLVMTGGILTLPPLPNNATTARANGGTIDLTGSRIDLRNPTPRLTTPPNKALLANIAVPDTLGEKLGPFMSIFGGKNSSAGSLSVTAVSVDRLPLGALMNVTSDPATGETNDGRAELLINILDLKPGGPLLSEVIGLLSKDLSQSLQGAVKDGRVTIAGGNVDQDLTVTYGQQGKRLVSTRGGVRLRDLAYQNFSVGLPSALLGAIPESARRYVPEDLSLPVGGTVPRPSLQADQVISSLVREAIQKGAVDSLLGGNKPAPSQPGQPAQPGDAKPKEPDPVGGLIDLLRKKDDKKKKP
jgi:hypothetical protein